MKVLVTGATGFIGGHVTRMLVEQGRDVRVMVLPGEPIAELSALGVEIVQGDLGASSFPASLFADVDTIYHLAAIYALWMPKPARMYQVNVEGTVRFFKQAMAETTLRKVVHTSSIAAVGLLPGRTPSDEQTAFNLWDDANDYILSKYISELEVQRLCQHHGLPATIVNPAFPFGPGDRRPTPTGETLVKMLQGQFPGILDGGICAVDVEDVARGHLLAEEKGAIGERYLLAGHNITYRELVEAISALTGLKFSTRVLPARLFGAVGGALEWLSDHVTHKAPLLTAKSIRYSAQYAFFDNTKAREVLGLSITPLDETLRKTIRWFCDHGYVSRNITLRV